MSSSEFKEKINWLFNQFPVFQKVGESAYKPTLENTLSLIDFFKVPIHQMKFVHVAGTNGKGTTCSIIASALTTSGKKVGLFTSPHIKDFRERIRVDGEMISEHQVVEYVHKIQKNNFAYSPSFFEMTWVMALDYFYQKKCDIIVVETGLGGRLDATNVIQPELSVITNIGLDHVAILGNTRKEIAVEKAGIIKENTPVIIGESDEEISNVFIEAAGENNAPIEFLSVSEGLNTFGVNKRLAYKAIHFLLKDDSRLESVKNKAIQNLYKNTGLYGRNQIYNEKPLTLLDGAHNEMGISRFIADVKKQYSDRKIRVLYGASNDKDLDLIVGFFPQEWTYFFTAFNSPRSMKVSDFRNHQKINQLDASFFTDAEKAFSEVQSVSNKEDVVLVFGSFYLLEEIY